METFKCVVPSWHEIYHIAKETVDKIKKSGFHPDLIVALSRGGLVPGRLFCDLLHIKTCLTMKVDHWGITATKDGKAVISHGLNADLSGARVLVVDDITDTGQSMILGKEHVAGLNPAVVKTATLIHLKNSKYVPDFFGVEREWAWIIFPWNYREDLVNLIKKITDSGRGNSVKEIRMDLKEMFDVETGEGEIREIMEHIEYLERVNKK